MGAIPDLVVKIGAGTDLTNIGVPADTVIKPAAGEAPALDGFVRGPRDDSTLDELANGSLKEPGAAHFAGPGRKGPEILDPPVYIPNPTDSDRGSLKVAGRLYPARLSPARGYREYSAEHGDRTVSLYVKASHGAHKTIARAFGKDHPFFKVLSSSPDDPLVRNGYAVTGSVSDRGHQPFMRLGKKLVPGGNYRITPEDDDHIIPPNGFVALKFINPHDKKPGTLYVFRRDVPKVFSALKDADPQSIGLPGGVMFGKSQDGAHYLWIGEKKAFKATYVPDGQEPPRGFRPLPRAFFGAGTGQVIVPEGRVGEWLNMLSTARRTEDIGFMH
jgi:hypothetical protein